MKIHGILVGIAGLLLAMVAAVVIKELGEGDGRNLSGSRSVPVQIAEVRAHAFADTVEAVGTVRAEESVAITASVADTVTSIDFVSGDTVRQGAVLLTLADVEERALLAEADAALAEARREAERLQQLSRNNAVARSELDRARSAVTRSEAQLEVARARLRDHVIRAPFDGQVGLRNVSVGAYVRPGDVLLTLDHLQNVDLDFTVPERFLAVLERGLPVRARATAYADEAFDGVISDIDSRVDPVTRAVTVRARLPNADRRLRPGMLLAVEIRRDERTAPAVPEVAVMRDGERVAVFGVVESDGVRRAVSRPVRLGARDGALIEVLDGLATGDTIISEGMHRARDGVAVEVRSTLADEQHGASTADGDSTGNSTGAGDS